MSHCMLGRRIINIPPRSDATYSFGGLGDRREGGVKTDGWKRSWEWAYKKEVRDVGETFSLPGRA